MLLFFIMSLTTQFSNVVIGKIFVNRAMWCNGIVGLPLAVMCTWKSRIVSFAFCSSLYSCMSKAEANFAY